MILCVIHPSLPLCSPCSPHFFTGVLTLPIVQAGGSLRAPQLSPVIEENCKSTVCCCWQSLTRLCYGQWDSNASIFERQYHQMIWHFHKKVYNIRHLWSVDYWAVSLTSCLKKISKGQQCLWQSLFHSRQFGQHCFTLQIASSGHILASIYGQKTQGVCVTVPWKWKALDSLWKPWTWVTPSKPSPSVSSSNTLIRRAGSTPKPTTNLQTQKQDCHCY